MLRVSGAVPVAGVLHRRYRNSVLCFGARQHVFRLRTDPRGRLCFRKGVAQDARLAHVIVWQIGAYDLRFKATIIFCACQHLQNTQPIA